MTEQRRAKQAIRTRMAQTGEKYTQARRAVHAGGDAASEPPAPPQQPVAAQCDGDPAPLGWFTDQAYNAVLLAQDEARMLGRAQVAPEHLLLATARRGNVPALLARVGVDAGAIHAALVRRDGLGPELVLGEIPLAAETEAVLRRAIDAADERGVVGPSTEHLLLGLQLDAGAVAILRELGVGEVTALVDAARRATRPPLPSRGIGRDASAARLRKPPRPGPIPPVFERFDEQAHATIARAVKVAADMESSYVCPAHILLAVLESPDRSIAAVRASHERELAAVAARTQQLLAGPPMRPTDIFSDAARRVVAQDVLVVARRLGHESLRVGHLLLALLDSDDDSVSAACAGLPDAAGIAAGVSDALDAPE